MKINKKTIDTLQVIGITILNLVLLSAFVWNILINIV